jgi:hypothetical protein
METKFQHSSWDSGGTGLQSENLVRLVKHAKAFVRHSQIIISGIEFHLGCGMPIVFVKCFAKQTNGYEWPDNELVNSLQ